MRIVGYIVLCGVVGVATGLIFERVILGVLVGAALLLLGIFLLIGRTPETEIEDTFDT